KYSPLRSSSCRRSFTCHGVPQTMTFPHATMRPTRVLLNQATSFWRCPSVSVFSQLHVSSRMARSSLAPSSGPITPIAWIDGSFTWLGRSTTTSAWVHFSRAPEAGFKFRNTVALPPEQDTQLVNEPFQGPIVERCSPSLDAKLRTRVRWYSKAPLLH